MANIQIVLMINTVIANVSGETMTTSFVLSGRRLMSLTEEMEALVIILCARHDNAAADDDNDNHHRENLSFLIF